ncbi:MAG: hypothetical protein AB7F19_07475 [Candidatus Babeliales bacterium]
MSFLSTISNALAPKAPVQQPQPQGQQQQQQPSGDNPGSGGGNPNNPNNQKDGTNQPQVSPMDQYNKMYDNTPAQTDTPPAFNLDSKTLDSVTGSMDFFQGFDPQLMEQVKTGNMDAVMQLMQHSNRQAYRAAMQHGSALTDKFVGMRESHFQEKGLPSRIKDQLTTNALSGPGGAKMHPAAKKQLVEIAQRLSKQHPDAPPEEIAEMSRTYVSDLYNALNPNAGQQEQEQQKANAPTDWETYFN